MGKLSAWELTKIAGVAAVIILVGWYFRSPPRPECTLDLQAALDRSRAAILQGSAEEAPARCTAYRAHRALLESSKRCIGVKSIASLDSEIAAYERLIAQTCSS
jgi:hypothetical protein